MNKFRLLLMMGLLSLYPAAAQMPELLMGIPGMSAASQISASASASVQSYAAGKPFWIALEVSITPPWHAYYHRNPGTVGEGMTAELQAPEGFTVKGPYWQVPTRHEGVTGVAYAYENPVVVWELCAAENAPAQAEFRMSCTAQTCSDDGCNPPETQEASVMLSAGDGAANPAWKELQKQVEGPGDTPTEISASQKADAVQLHFTAEPGLEKAYFFSADNSISPTAAQTLAADASGTHYTLTLPRNDNSDSMYPVLDEATVGKPLPRLQGTLCYGARHCTVDVEPQAAPVDLSMPEGLAALCFSLFLGGLILNLMPCVFPVIGLKVMSFVQMGGGSRRRIFAHSMAFVLGVLVSFWFISLLLIVFSNLGTLSQTPWTEWAGALLQDAGSASRSWAAWMQNPWIVYGILLLLLVLGMSMYGVFEIGASITGAGQEMQQKEGFVGSFFQGLFVTVVATPCSAPFLGAAMPAAMALPGVWMLAALTFMALGLSFPYIVLGCFPALVQKLPAPGEWMESLKQGLSFALFAAAGWMLYVYLSFWPVAESTETMWVYMALVVFCAAFWVYGRWCSPFRSRKARVTGFCVALLLAGLGFWGARPYEADKAKPEWQAWSAAAMQEALEDERPVYVDFTAKWCATCQMNKKVAYSDEVYALLEKGDVLLLRADKTSPNPEIDAEMRRLNRSSVPVNALYLPGKEPLVTSELLTPDYLANFLQQHLPQEKQEDAEN